MKLIYQLKVRADRDGDVTSTQGKRPGGFNLIMLFCSVAWDAIQHDDFSQVSIAKCCGAPWEKPMDYKPLTR